MAPRFSFTRTKQRKISFHTIPPGASQITVVTSDHSTLPHTITKCEPTNADSWLKGEPVKNDVYDVFWPVDAWDITTGAYTGVGARNYDRATELAPFGLPWSSSDGKKIALGFGTCVDVIHDKKHGEVNLCIYLGSGLPLANIAMLLTTSFLTMPIIGMSQVRKTSDLPDTTSFHKLKSRRRKVLQLMTTAVLAT